MADLPRVNYTTNAVTGLKDVALTVPGNIIFPALSSSFPTTTDAFKYITYTAPSDATAKANLATYHSIMVKIMNGTAVQADLDNLKTILTSIKNYTLTEDDYNLMIDAIRKIEEYVRTYFSTDLEAKAAKLDEILAGYQKTLNEFMQSLETIYSNSPDVMPIADGSITVAKLTPAARNYLSSPIPVSATQPSSPTTGSHWIKLI